MGMSHVAAQVLMGLSWILALAWLWHAVAVMRGMATLPDLTRIDPGSLPPLTAGDDSDLTVIVPACNEEKSIGATLRSLHASRGVRVEVIAVNDRSTDRTGALMDEVVAEAAASGSSIVSGCCT